MPLRPSISHPLPTVFLPALLLVLGLCAATRAETSGALAGARAAVESGDADEALRLLGPLVDRRRPDPEALVVASEARVLQGDVAAAYEHLEKALELDPTLRQGWMNLAGLEIAQREYASALSALEKARELDPEAEDNHLNLGAVHVLMGNEREARSHFDRYLSHRDASAESYYLVAANYAIGGWADAAVAALEQAIRLDESVRLRARSDDRFLALDSSPAYRELLERDLYTAPADHRTAAAAFPVAWERQNPRLLYALLDAMREAGLDWQPTIETATTWAVVRGRLRAKIATQPNGTGVVRLSAPPERWTAAEWNRLTQRIFRSMWTRLQSDSR